MPALANLSWPRRTQRLVIRPVTDADLPAVWGWRSIPAVMEWMGVAPMGLEEFVRTFPEKDRPSKTLVIEYDGRLVGDLYVSIEDAWGQADVAEQARQTQAEIGWVVHPDVQGRGLATEAARELLAICLQPAPDGLGLRRVVAHCFAANEPSWRIMERLGMRREAHNRQDCLHRSRGWQDGYSYALLADEVSQRP